MRFLEKKFKKIARNWTFEISYHWRHLAARNESKFNKVQPDLSSAWFKLFLLFRLIFFIVFSSWFVFMIHTSRSLIEFEAPNLLIVTIFYSYNRWATSFRAQVLGHPIKGTSSSSNNKLNQLQPQQHQTATMPGITIGPSQTPIHPSRRLAPVHRAPIHLPPPSEADKNWASKRVIKLKSLCNWRRR